MTKLKIGKHREIENQRVPPQSYLVELLPSQGITSQQTLTEYIEKHYQSDEAIPFRVVRAQDLELDGEGRLYEDEVDFENVIVDVPRVNLQNSPKIRLVNCLFTGDLWIGQKGDAFDSVCLDHCIIGNKLLISSVKEGRIDLLRVNAPDAHVNLLEHTKGLSISECHFGDFCFKEAVRTSSSPT